MGFKPYYGKDVQTGIGGYIQLKLPEFKNPVWCTPYIVNTDLIEVFQISILGWDYPRNNQRGWRSYSELSEENKKLIQTVLTEEQKELLSKLKS